MAKASWGDAADRRGRDHRPFRPGEMPPAFGDTAAVLVVDDDPQLAQVLDRLLSREGYRCTLAASAAEARSRLSEGRFALALVDVMMPGESGLELAAELLASHQDLAVVMVTGVDDPHVAELALRSGAYGYVVKPFRANQVLITVANAGMRRCVEIERDLYERRLEVQVDEQAADLDEALLRLKKARQQVVLSPSEQGTLRGLVEAAPDAIVAVDANGVIALVNAQTERLFGYSRDELVGQPVELLVPEHARAVHPERRGGYLADPQPRSMGVGMELAGRRKDGTEFPAEISLSAIETDEGPLVSAAVRDVSDRKRAEAKFRGLLEAAPDAIVGVGPDGLIALVNAQAERLFGYYRDEMVGEPVEILVPEGVRGIHPTRRSGYFTDPTPRPMGAGMELAGRRKDGTEFPAEISLSAIETEEGVLVSAAVRDVTDRRRAAEAQAQLASIVRSSHDAIIGETLDGVITTWNPGAERLYGYNAEEMVGASMEALIPPGRRAEEAENLARIARGERIEQYQSERVRKDGNVVSVSLSASPIADASGQIIGAARMSRDISDRQRAEARFRGLLEAAPDAVVGVDAQGNIALVNAQAERLFGYGRKELEGQRVEILVPEAARAIHPSRRSGYFADPTPRPMGAGIQLAGRRKDGTEFPAEISLSALETEEGLLVSAAVRDVTERIEAQAERERLKAQAERERLEGQLHQSQRLESLGQLAGGVAHDFNNLLGAIMNYASFVGEEVAAVVAREPSHDWPAVERDVGQIQRAAERAAQLTHQLLAFARREVVRPQVLVVNDVVGEVEQLLRRTIGEHVELNISTSQSTPATPCPGAASSPSRPRMWPSTTPTWPVIPAPAWGATSSCG